MSAGLYRFNRYTPAKQAEPNTLARGASRCAFFFERKE